MVQVFNSNLSQHEHAVAEQQDAEIPSQAPAAPVRPADSEQPLNQNLAGIPAHFDFESKWKDFLSRSQAKHLYAANDKAMALIGFHWGLSAMLAIVNEQRRLG